MVFGNPPAGTTAHKVHSADSITPSVEVGTMFRIGTPMQLSRKQDITLNIAFE